MSSRRRVLVLYGGRSSEHEVSCLSARSVLSAIDRDRYEVITVGITRDGRWTLTDGDIVTRKGDPLPSVDDRGPTVALVRDRSGTRLVRFGDDDSAHDLGGVDVCFPVLHGPFGEDGTVQGLLATMQVPYVGAGVTASAIGVDKRAMKHAFAAAGLPQVPYRIVTHQEFVDAPEDVLDSLQRSLPGPMFTKPSRSGSSIGISKVENREELRDGIESAFGFDVRVVVEQALERPRELEVGLLEEPGEGVRTTPVGEIALHEGFYDFRAKYLDESELIAPARLPAATSARVEQIARGAYEAVGCRGLARVDVFLSAEGDLVVNEINTVPDLRRGAVFARLWGLRGWSFEDLIERLLGTAALWPSIPDSARNQEAAQDGR